MGFICWDAHPILFLSAVLDMDSSNTHDPSIYQSIDITLDLKQTVNN